MGNEVVNQSVPVAACSPHPQNYNQHDEGQVADLRLSLRKFGQVRSVVVQDDGAGGFLLVAGHGVQKAAQAEGLAELRADVIPADWTPARVLAYLAADNELARPGQPDEAQLAALVQQVEAELDAEMARLAAGGEMEREILLIEAEMAEMLEDMLGDGSGAAGGSSAVRQLGDRSRQVKPILYVEDLTDFEEAIRRTGNLNRGEAMMIICRHYLEAHGGNRAEKG